MRAYSWVLILLYNLLGVLLFTGRFPQLVAGYLNTPQEKRDRYDWVKISRFVAWMFWVSSIGLFLMWSHDLQPQSPWRTAGVALFLGTVLGGAVYVNLSKRFRK